MPGHHRLGTLPSSSIVPLLPSALASPAGALFFRPMISLSQRVIEQLREVLVREALELYRVIKEHTPDPLPLRCLEYQRMEAQVHTERAVPLPRGQVGPVPLPGLGVNKQPCIVDGS